MTQWLCIYFWLAESSPFYLIWIWLKTLMTQWSYIFLAGLFYFMNKTPSDQKPNDLVTLYLFLIGIESSPFLLLNDPVTFHFPIQLKIIVWQTKNQVTQWNYTLFPDRLTSCLFKQWLWSYLPLSNPCDQCGKRFHKRQRLGTHIKFSK